MSAYFSATETDFSLINKRWLKNLANQGNRNFQLVLALLDEYRGILDIVTLEDILESLVDDIWDEYDQVINDFEKLNELTLLFENKRVFLNSQIVLN